MIVVVERPETTIFGARRGAIFQEVMSYALHHYNIRRTHLSEAAEGSAPHLLGVT